MGLRVIKKDNVLVVRLALIHHLLVHAYSQSYDLDKLSNCFGQSFMFELKNNRLISSFIELKTKV